MIYLEREKHTIMRKKLRISITSDLKIQKTEKTDRAEIEIKLDSSLRSNRDSFNPSDSSELDPAVEEILPFSPRHSNSN